MWPTGKSITSSSKMETIRLMTRILLSAGGIKRDKVQEEAEEILGAMERDKTQLDFVHNQVSKLISQVLVFHDMMSRLK